MYRKLKRIWSHNDAKYIPKFKEIFPELNHISNEEMRNRWIKLGVDFFVEKFTPVNIWIRLTFPFALILMVLMFICLPFNFLITGNWSYKLSQKNKILNWFRSLHLCK